MAQGKPTVQGKKRRSKTLLGATQANRQYKSSVFADLLSMREAALEAYCALKNVRLPADTPVEIITLQDVLYLGQLNDVAFKIGNAIVVLLEHQSTLSPNVVIRLLIYLGREYEKMLAEYHKELYSTTLFKIPRPELFVLYNGEKPLKDDDTGHEVDFRTYKLSDAFMDAPEGAEACKGHMELEVPVYDINEGRNPEIMERSALLRQYAQLISKIRQYEKAGNELQQAIKLAVDYCIANDILKAYLEEKAAEVLGLLFEEFRLEDYGDVRYRDGRKEGRQEGYLDGQQAGYLDGQQVGYQTGKLDDVINMYNDGVTIQQIARWKKLPESVIENVLNQKPQTAEAGYATANS